MAGNGTKHAGARPKWSFTLFVEERGSTKYSRFFCTNRQFVLLAVTACLIVLGFITGSVVLLTEWHLQNRTGRLIEENRLLNSEIAEMRGRVDTISNTVDSLGQEEDAIRVRVNLPALGEDVRRAGIGSVLPLEGEVIGDERIEELMIALDQIERQLDVQVQSFEEIQRKIANDEERLRHIPSIIPVQDARLTDGFGNRRDPFTNQVRFHHGADFAAPRGTPVCATADGVVVRVGRMSGYGKVVHVDHGYGYKTVYAHLDSYSVRRGQRVERGEIIGALGNTGRSTGPHLHYEVRVENRAVDPLDYFYEGFELAEQ